MRDANVSRRTFLKTSGALGALAVAGGVATNANALFGGGTAQAVAEPEDKIVWSHCHVNCGGACVLQIHMKDGEIAYVESDNTGDGSFAGEGFQARACLRGRSIRRWINGPDRLNYPMRRIAGTQRGEGKYERISWDEALDTIASEFDRVRKTYGNEAIFIQECSGVEQNVMMNNPFFRLFNLLGGEVTRYGNYSSGALSWGAQPFTYGGGWGSRSYNVLADNELVVFFGNSPAETRMAGDGAGYDLAIALAKKNVHVICIDPRRNDLITNHEVEWIPIVPGTDAALVAGLAHELIKANLVDTDFLHKYCVGYDEETLPEGAPANSSYYAYVMGAGYDKVEKTPAWAASITKIPEERIVKLAHEIGEAKPCYIAQGLGPQRHTNGDYAARAIMLLPQLVGQVGLPSTNSGMTSGNTGWYMPSLPTGDNPIQEKFPNFLWPEAIAEGASMTDTNAGIQNASKLKQPIKFLVNYGNNMMSNQNGDINTTTDILKDESKCEFILQYDVVWSDSCNWADIVLPDLTPQETWTLSANGESNCSAGVWLGQPICEPRFERREVYEVCADLAKRLGVEQEYTEGKTREDWVHQLFDEFREEHPEVPTWEQMLKQGIFKGTIEEPNETDPFILDPEANPLKTETGKIQIYSPELARRAKEWTLPEGDVIYPIPVYVPGYDGPGQETEEYPLQLCGYHTKAHTHSSYANNEIIQDAHRHNVLINPLDAEPRGIVNNDIVRVKSAQGEVEIEARVTNRVIPGTVMIPEGAWHSADMQGDKVDKGGCLNTLTTRHPNPISKQTGQHNALVEVRKA